MRIHKRDLFGYALVAPAMLLVLGFIVYPVGEVVRLSFTNTKLSIMYDDLMDTDDLMMFCEGIYIARHKQKLAKEEELYRRLIKIYRTPTMLVELAKRKDKKD